jgi:hypothetical protein
MSGVIDMAKSFQKQPKGKKAARIWAADNQELLLSPATRQGNPLCF